MIRGFRKKLDPPKTHEIQPPPEALRSLRAAVETINAAKTRTIQSAILANNLAAKRARNHFRDTIQAVVQD